MAAEQVHGHRGLPGLDHLWIFGCHGGAQQRFTVFDPTTTAAPAQQLSFLGLPNMCAGFKDLSANPVSLRARLCTDQDTPFFTFVRMPD